MKTIREALGEIPFFAAYMGNGKYYTSSQAFEAGVAFAEEWISVKDELPTKEHKTILLRYDNNMEKVSSGFVRNDSEIYPHFRGNDWTTLTDWRPINRK